MRISSTAGALVSALITALFAAPTQAQAPPTDPCTPPQQDTGFAEVTFDVATGTTNRVLPFDVPLRICGTVPGGSRSVRVRYAEGKTPVQADGRSCAAGQSPWRPGPPLEARVDPATDSFRVVVPRLDAQRYYAFCFLVERQLNDELKAKLEAPLRAALDGQLATITTGDLSADDTAALRGTLRDAILSELLTATGGEAVISAGSLFDPTVPVDAVRPEFVAKVREVLGPQLALRDVLDGRPAGAGAAATPSYAARQFDLASAVKAIAADPALGRLVTALRQAAAGDPNLATLLQDQYADELAVADLSADAGGRLAKGQDPAGTDSAELSTTTDPAAAGAIAARYQTLADTLGGDGGPDSGLGALIGRFVAPGAPEAVAAGLSDSDRSALAALTAGAVTRGADGAFELAGIGTTVQAGLAARSAALDRLLAVVKLALTDVSIADASTSGNFETASTYYISADGGLLAAPAIDEILPYVGTNVYFRPVNKNAPLKSLGSFRATFTRRFAVTLGLTASSVAETVDGVTVRDNLFSSQALVVGAGIRLTDMIRLGAGALVFKEDDPSPLVDELSVAATYYVSVSFDLNVARTFQGGLGALFQ